MITLIQIFVLTSNDMTLPYSFLSLKSSGIRLKSYTENGKGTWEAEDGSGVINITGLTLVS